MSVTLSEDWFPSVPGEVGKEAGLEASVSFSVPRSPKTSSILHFCQFL